MDRPYRLGLTGGIASGKNKVADMLAARGATVVDADLVSRDLVQPGMPLLARLAETWGADIVDAQGALNRALLASRVFGRDDEVKRLNAITHPAILAEMEHRADAAATGVVVFMAPLLLEADGGRLVDEVWLVTAPEDLRVARILRRDAITETEARARIAAQMKAQESARQAQVVIDNAGDLVTTEGSVEAAWQALLQRRTARTSEEVHG